MHIIPYNNKYDFISVFFNSYPRFYLKTPKTYQEHLKQSSKLKNIKFFPGALCHQFNNKIGKSNYCGYTLVASVNVASKLQVNYYYHYYRWHR